MSIIITRGELTHLLSCPQSHLLMQDPVIDPCGHTFEREQIEGRISVNPTCPLSKRPITVDQLMPNRAVRLALEILAHLPAGTATSDSDVVQFSTLDEDSRGILSIAIKALRAQIELDRQNNIPERLPVPEQFGQRVIKGCKEFYKC